jgi:23S rRNA (guanine745-N1)-methyltransferase
MIQCPICKLDLIESKKLYACANNHTFDKSKYGYTNLFLSNSKRLHGDNDLMIHARHRFLHEGHYTFLLEKLHTILQSYALENCVDLGCGEGYYTNDLANRLTNIQFIGFDLSKTALKLASKQSKARYFCASIADLPIKNSSIDCVLCIFAPFKLDEIKRVLKPNGLFIVVNPSQNHLYGLKKELYETVKLNPIFSLNTNDFDFELVQSYQIKKELVLNTPESIRDLLDMTPYRYHAKESSIQTFYQLSTLSTELSFQCDVYKHI